MILMDSLIYLGFESFLVLALTIEQLLITKQIPTRPQDLLILLMTVVQFHSFQCKYYSMNQFLYALVTLQSQFMLSFRDTCLTRWQGALFYQLHVMTPSQ